MARTGKKRRRKDSEGHWTKMLRETMETEAWRALKPTAQALYPWIKLNWKGREFNNNGKIQFSARQAAKAMGINVNTAASAFQDLQAKGFIRVTEIAHLGTDGYGKSTRYEITELVFPGNVNEENLGPRLVPSKLYMIWRSGNDFSVQKARANNPTGVKNIKPEADKKINSHLKNCDEPFLKIGTVS